VALSIHCHYHCNLSSSTIHHPQHSSEQLIINTIEASAIENGTPQMHMSIFQERTVTIKPKASVLLPILFIPKFPSHAEPKGSTGTGNHSNTENKRRLTRAVVADIAEMIGSGQTESSLQNNLHLVQTSVRIDTSRGTMNMSFNATALEGNPYHLPHTIAFYSDGYVSSGEILAEQGRLSFLASKRHGARYQFDLYMDNPFHNVDIPIYATYLSRPDLIHISYSHDGKNRFNNCGPSSDCNYPSAHDFSGPPIIPPLAKKAYIATLHVDPEVLDVSLRDVKAISLGNLQINTPNTTFTIILEYVHGGIDSNKNEELSGNNETRLLPKRVSGGIKKDDKSLLKIGNSSQLPLLGGNRGKIRLKCDAMKRKPEVYITQRPTSNSKVDIHTTTGTLSASQNVLDFGLLTSVNDERKVGISVTNNGDIPVRPMRYKVSIDVPSPSGESEKNVFLLSTNGDVNKDIALRANIHFKGQNRSRVIQPGETEKNLAFISLSSAMLPSVQSTSTMPLVYNGSVLVYFGLADTKYDDWKKSVIHDPFGSQGNVLEISFQIRIMYGEIKYNVNDVYFPTQRSSLFLPSETPNLAINGECSKGFHRTIHFKNIFPAAVRLVRMEIEDGETEDGMSSSYDCRQHFKIYDFEGSEHNTQYSKLSKAKPGESWGGISLRYKYAPVSTERNPRRDVATCTLVLETDIAGIFHIPLHVFSGMVRVDPERTIAPIECQDDHHNTAKYGMDCLGSVKNKTSIGSMLSTSMSALYGDKNAKQGLAGLLGQKGSGSKNFNELIVKHFSGLADIPIDTNGILVEPILLTLGSMSSDTIETHSVYITNHNPLPMSIHGVISAVEGMEVRLARVTSNIMNYIDAADTKVQEGEHQSNKWLKKYLLELGNSSSFLENFSFRDDISLSRDASTGLENLYHAHAKLRLHSDRVNMSTVASFSNENHDQSQRSDQIRKNMQPPEFTKKRCSKLTLANESVRPFLVINDEVCRLEIKDPQSTSPWIIPPGGTAKLELLVRSPTKHALHKSDISEILTTGIVLQSDFGQLMPIIATYRALSGRLKTIPPPEVEQNTTEAKHWVETTPVLRSKCDDKKLQLDSMTKQSNSTFTIENTFSTNLLLRKVHSCNKWFQVHVHHNASINRPKSTTPHLLRSGESVQATVHSSIHCPASFQGLNPSFFNCAIDWLKKSLIMRSDDCGDIDQDDEMALNDINTSTEIESSIQRAVKVFDRALSYMENRYTTGSTLTKGGKADHSSSHSSVRNGVPIDRMVQPRTDVSSEITNMFRDAFIEWRSLCKLGLNVVRGSAQAQFDLLMDEGEKESSESMSRTISTTLGNSFFKTSLDVPRLFDEKNEIFKEQEMTGMKNIVDFGVVTVSHPSEMFVPVVNPSGYPLRIRLVTPDYLEKDSRPLGESQVFVQAKSGLKHSWWTGGSYFLTDEKGALLISNHNVTIETAGGSSLSLMNPSIHSSSAFTHGCSGRRCGSSFPTNNDQGQLDDIKHTTPIGASSSVGTMLSGRLYSSTGNIEKAHGKVPPTYFFPPFALGIKGTKEITIPPYASANLGPIYFRPPSRNQFRANIFLENSLTGMEKIQVKGSGGWEKVIFLETNDIGIDGGSIETRFNKPALMFTQIKNEPHRTSVKDVLVANLGDTTVKFDGLRLSEAKIVQNAKSNQIQPNLNDSRCERRGFKLLDCQDTIDGNANNTETNVLDGFVLKAKEAKHLRVMHTFDCTFRSMYVSLVLDYANETNQIVVEKNMELLLGYDLNSNEINFCNHQLQGFKSTLSGLKRSLGYPSKTRKKGILLISSLILPLLILGLILIDIVYTANRRRISSKVFRSTAAENSNKTGFKNWNVAFRCLSRAEPDSSDLVNMGKEQTRQILLTRYRKEGILQPQCILPNGTFSRERQLFSGNPNENRMKNSVPPESSRSTSTRSRRSSNTVTKTLSETIFFHYQSFKQPDRASSETGLVLPHGLDWKRAAKRGIIQLNGKPAQNLQDRAPCRRDTALKDESFVKKSDIKKHESCNGNGSAEEVIIKKSTNDNNRAKPQNRNSIIHQKPNITTSHSTTTLQEIVQEKPSKANIKTSTSDFKPVTVRTTNVPSKEFKDSSTKKDGLSAEKIIDEVERQENKRLKDLAMKSEVENSAAFDEGKVDNKDMFSDDTIASEM
jgi:hypothetical protein